MCNFIDNEPIITFTEKINVKKALQLRQLYKQEIKSIFWESKEIDKKDNSTKDWSSYSNSLKFYCQKAINNKGEIKQTYKYGKLKYDGRLYVNNIGLQTLQSKIRNFLCGDYYIELDMRNCYPSLFLYFIESNNLKSQLLTDYVNDRESILSKYDLTKFDILKVLNTDKNKNKNNNHWYNYFIQEMQDLKNQLKSKIELPSTNNINNQLYASINKLICNIEGDIIQKLIKYINPKNIGFPIFDGVHLDRNYKLDL